LIADRCPQDVGELARRLVHGQPGHELQLLAQRQRLGTRQRRVGRSGDRNVLAADPVPDFIDGDNGLPATLDEAAPDGLPMGIIPRRGRIHHPERSLSAPMHIADTVAEVNRDAPFPATNTLAKRPELSLDDGTALMRTTSKPATHSQELPR
jgi:hypothetical protein